MGKTAAEAAAYAETELAQAGMTGSAGGGAEPTAGRTGAARDAARAGERRRSYAAHIVAFLIVAIGALDCVSTNLALGTGFTQELNPVVAWAQATFGAYWVWPKMAIHALLAAVLLANPSRAALIAMSVVAVLTLTAAINNLVLYQAYAGPLV